MTGDEFTREAHFRPGYDLRDIPGSRYGARGMGIEFILRGPLGAISADISTGWMAQPLTGRYIPGGPNQRRDDVGIDFGVQDCYPTGSGIHSHCPEKRRDWWLGPDECRILGGPCYGDTGYLVSDEFLTRLVRGGEEAAWGYLRWIYDSWLDEELSPDAMRQRPTDSAEARP